MSRLVVYVALQQFCEFERRPLELLQEAGFEVQQNRLGRRLVAEELPELLREADAVLAGVEPYSAALLDSLPRLRCISRCGIGTDAIDLAAAARLGIRVLTTGEEIVEPVAQMAVAMILALARNLHLHARDAAGGLWRKRTGALLREWTIGLVGFGRIGRAVERCLRPFEPRVVVADPEVPAAAMPEGVRLVSLEGLLGEADLVSVHASAARGEAPLIGRSAITAMKRGSYLVNTARGHLVDEQALYGALVSGHLAGAALDVFEAEPYTGPLASLPQVLCTPHVSTLTRASRAAMERRCAQGVVDFFAGRKRPGRTTPALDAAGR